MIQKCTNITLRNIPLPPLCPWMPHSIQNERKVDIKGQRIKMITVHNTGNLVHNKHHLHRTEEANQPSAPQYPTTTHVCSQNQHMHPASTKTVRHPHFKLKLGTWTTFFVEWDASGNHKWWKRGKTLFSPSLSQHTLQLHTAQAALLGRRESSFCHSSQIRKELWLNRT